MSGAAILELKQHFSLPKADEYIRGSQLRQGDYSRKQGEVQALRNEVEQTQVALAAKEEANQRYNTELVQWKAGAEGAYNKALADREKAEGTAARAVARLKSSAAQLGLNEEDLLRDLDVPVATQTAKELEVDTSKFVTKEMIQQTAREAAVLEGILGDVAEEHSILFPNQRLNRTQLVQEAIAAGKSVEAHWADKFKVSDRRAAIASADIDRRISEAVAAKEAELRSTIPGNQLSPRAEDANNPMLRHKIFTNKALMDQNHASNEGGGGQSSGVSAAVAAFQAGTHRSR